MYKLIRNQQQLLEVLGDFKPTNQTVFQSKGWIETWLSIQSKVVKDIYCVASYHDNELVGVLLTYINSNNKLMFIGTGEPENEEVCPEYLDILFYEIYKDAVILDVIDFLTSCKLNFDFRNMLATSAIVNAINSTSLKSNLQVVGQRYYVDLTSAEHSFENYLAKIPSRSHRKKLTRLNKQILQNRGLQIEDVSFEFNDSLNELKNLHTEQWNSKGKTGAFSSPKFIEFHRRLALTGEVDTQLLMIILDNIVVGIGYCIIDSGNVYYYQSGFLQGVEHKVSPGHIFHVAMINSAMKDRYQMYDFMKGSLSHSYKEKYANQKELMYDFKTKSLNEKLLSKAKQLAIQFSRS